MGAASKLRAGNQDGEDQDGITEQKAQAQLPWVPDWKELVHPAAVVIAVIAFNKSEYGKKWYADVAKAYPDKEKLAKKLFYGVGGAVSEPTFWIPTLSFIVLDFLQPKWLNRLRLQKDVPPPGLLHVLKTFAVSYVVQYYLIAYLQKKYIYPIWRKGVRDEDLVKHPSALRTVVEFIECEILGELIFYITHRLFHSKYIYKWVHKRHHENRTPFALANLYSDPVDVIFNNLPTTFLPSAIVGAHPTTFWAYLAWRNLHGCLVHCGYDVPFLADVRHHDWHHRKFDGNYGLNTGIVVLDRIFGTTSPSYVTWLEKWNAERDPITHLEFEKNDGSKDGNETVLAPS